MPAVDSLRAELESRGWSDWAYHFLWSQVLDSQFAWVVMVERGLVPPLSTVVAWAIYPDHPWKTGTNYVPEEPADYFMAISWTPGGSSLAAIYEDWRPIYDAALAGAPADSATAARLRPLRLLDDRGNVTLPVVHDHDPLYERLRQLSTRAPSAIAALLPVHELETLTHLDRQLVFAMAYHDVGWEMLRLAAEAGRVVRPRALTAGDVEDMRGAAAVIALYPPFLRLFGQ